MRERNERKTTTTKMNKGRKDGKKRVNIQGGKRDREKDRKRSG